MGAAGIVLTQSAEGKQNRAYLDPVGIPTVCYGHTGPEVKVGIYFTDTKCNILLIADLKVADAGVRRCVKAPLTQNQHDAVTDFAFNVGVPKFCKSTLAKRLNARDYYGASQEFPKWNKARDGSRVIVLRGLTTRRRAEQVLFLRLDTPRSQSARLANLRSLSDLHE